MNRRERAKAQALQRIRLLPGLWDEKFARSMAYIARTAPDTVLTPAQRYQLDLVVWRYRRQLAGRDDLGFPLPETEPQRDHYERPARVPRQRALF